MTSIGSDAFDDCKYNAQIIDDSYAITGDYSDIINKYDVIYCHRKHTYGSVNDLVYIEDLVYPIEREDKMKRLQFKLETKPNVEVSDIIIYDSHGNAVNDNNGLYVISDYKANISYKLYGFNVSYEIESTVKPELSILLQNATQSTLTIRASITNDGTMNVEKLIVYPNYFYDDSIEVQNGASYKLDYFCPESTYYVRLKASTDVGEHEISKACSTKHLNLRVEAVEYGPCRVKYVASWDDGDALIYEKGFTTDHWLDNCDGNLSYEAEGLDPSTDMPLYYVVKTKAHNGDSYQLISETISPHLPELEWYENTPVATSTTSCRIMSSTNCNANIGTGFEWKRYDAPDGLAATKVSCPVVDGILVGSLRNLNPEVYYKYRPYYTSNSGKTYYGDWTPLFTGDANVYFEPDVRTLEDIEILSNSAVLTGYVLPGSDDIKSQGFQYRRFVNQGSSHIAALGDQNTEEWISVPASGIKPTVTIEGLDFDAQYEYRVYATTQTETYYGESRYFKTEGQAGIEEIAINDSHNTLTLQVNSNPDVNIAVSGTSADNVAYDIYNVSGVHIAHGEVEADGYYHTIASGLSHGIYIIIVSDGSDVTNRKVIVR